jgi:hypothetical protein
MIIHTCASADCPHIFTVSAILLHLITESLQQIITMYTVYVHLLTAENHMSQTPDHGLKLESRSEHNPKLHLPPPYVGFGPISKRH